MDNVALHPNTKSAIDQFIARPGHALLLTAPQGAGKMTLARRIAGSLLGVEPGKLDGHPYVKIVESEKGKTISVESVRDAIHFTTLRPVATGDITRIIIIENGQLMTAQAQNALLKTIEEPPLGTLIIITAIGERTILPTIRSRVQHLSLCLPDPEILQGFFQAQGYGSAAIKKAILMSGGLPGLMHALLETDTTHPLYTATNTARDILQKTTFERVAMVDEIAKQRQLWSDALFILGQMAATALRQNTNNETTTRKWQRILRAVHEAEEQTASNAQAKLVALHFMLAL
jgi:DNA polymerase-3 subunit delta'